MGVKLRKRKPPPQSSPRLPESMRCIEISAPGKPEVLVSVSRPLPQPGLGEVLIAVCAAGVNRPDIAQRLGRSPAPPGASDLPGLEVSGIVVACGENVKSPALGASVCALLPGGGYAEYAVASAYCCLPIPVGMDFVAAAAIPETYFTVWHNVFERGALKEAETLLVHGGSSGIGTTAIQLAKAFGAKVIATAGSEVKCQACLDLGADMAINYKTTDFVAALKDASEGVNVVLDMVGGDYVSRNIACLKPDGRLVNIAFLNGSQVSLDLGPVMRNRLIMTGSTLRGRDVTFKGRLANALRTAVWPLLAKGRATPVIDRVLPLEAAAAAHAHMEAGAHIGKIVLTTSNAH